jgi:hypothetical protein
MLTQHALCETSYKPSRKKKAQPAIRHTVICAGDKSLQKKFRWGLRLHAPKYKIIKSPKSLLGTHRTHVAGVVEVVPVHDSAEIDVPHGPGRTLGFCQPICAPTPLLTFIKYRIDIQTVGLRFRFQQGHQLRDGRQPPVSIPSKLVAVQLLNILPRDLIRQRFLRSRFLSH